VLPITGLVVFTDPAASYFNEYALKELYLKDPVHSKFINVNMLSRYIPVGGVRIEDDVLVSWVQPYRTHLSCS
jgi:Xaa-Pro dipeptidase